MPRSPTSAAERCSSTICENCRRNHAIDVRQLVNFFDGPAAVERAEHRPHAAVGRHAQLALQRALLFFDRQRRDPSGACWPNSRPLRPSSSDRNAFMKASLNVRPIAIASPTDFICVVSVRSALRELLERPPRHLDDDVVDRRLEGRRASAA